MAKRDSKKPRLDLTEPGQRDGLKHSPFAALGGTTGADAKTPASPNASATAQETNERSRKPRGRLVLRRETKHRAGKAVVVVSGLRAHAKLDEPELGALAQRVKQQLGCGGTLERLADDTELVLQGDQPARVASILRELGFRVDGVTS